MTQPSKLQSVSTLVEKNDEIDLFQLLSSVLSVWKYWLVTLICVTLIFVSIKAFQIGFLVNSASYSKPIRLTFVNTKNLAFPSGAKFAYSDIVAPSVVQIAFERNKLRDFGFTVSDIQGALSSTPYSPTYPLILLKYGKLMSDKKNTVEQLNDLQKKMQEEVAQAVSGEALITLRLDKKELPQSVIENLLSDIPAIWAERAMNEKGVLQINAQLSGVNSLNAELIKQSEALVAGDLLYEKLGLINKNIKAMSEFEGAQSIKDPVTGMKLIDLTYAINDLGRYVIGNMIAPIRELGIARDSRAALFYYENRVSNLKSDLAAVNRQADAIKDVYGSYVQNDHKLSSQTKDNQSPSSVAPQISTDMLDKLVSLSGESVRENYKQNLSNKLFLLSKDIAVVESTLSDAQIVLSNLQKSVGKLSSNDEQFLIKFENGLPLVLEKVAGFFEVSQSIYRQLSIESVGVIDQLYTPVTNTILVNKSLLDIKATLLIWLALMFLTTVITIPIFMIRNAIKARAQVQLIN